MRLKKIHVIPLILYKSILKVPRCRFPKRTTIEHPSLKNSRVARNRSKPGSSGIPDISIHPQSGDIRKFDVNGFTIEK